MIKGIGIDLIEIKRIQEALSRGDKLINRVLTAEEQEIFAQIKNERRQLEYIAGRFAAKEAFAKATGRGIGKLSFQDIEILNLPSGAPRLSAKGYEHERIFVSISHTENYATAQVIIEEEHSSK